MCEAPEHLQSLGFEVGRLTSETIVKGTVRNALEARLGVPKDVIRLYEHPYVYLNEEEIQKTKYSVAEIETVVAEEIIKIPGDHRRRDPNGSAERILCPDTDQHGRSSTTFTLSDPAMSM